MTWFKAPPEPPLPQVWLVSNDFAVQLKPNEVIKVAQTLHVDQIDTVTIQAFDAKGNAIAFTPDSPPVWTDSAPAVVAQAPSADGLSDVLTPANAVGQSSTIGVTVIVGGQSFGASDTVTVVAGAIAQIKLVHNFSAAP